MILRAALLSVFIRALSEVFSSSRALFSHLKTPSSTKVTLCAAVLLTSWPAVDDRSTPETSEGTYDSLESHRAAARPPWATIGKVYEGMVR
ncbi:uncharacterized protein B0H18DRAFT_973956 [Fomitopsis serialis]|uniref:uncharacterized protein n=1 Tax=Fomitopsis serialis TaxID=139415 RepID=UPI002007FEF8|nr:uncharacterized protein B0H18DRAFT_973956 [Neoantrodia serialis]KAH9936435.1 hypothetical protein B0H18DRAFT_973956 [Neoantrodia serialis]